VARLGPGEVVDVVLRPEQAQLLPAEPDEAQLVQRVDVLHLLGDVEDRRGAGRVVQDPGSVDRIQVGIDDQDVVLVAALGFGDDVVVIGVGLDNRWDAQAHRRRGPRLVLVVEVLPDGERRERRDRDRRDERVPIGVDHAADHQAGPAGIALIEDDDPGGAGRLGVEDLHAEVASAALDQRDVARDGGREVGGGAATRRARDGGRWKDRLGLARACRAARGGPGRAGVASGDRRCGGGARPGPPADGRAQLCD
jgi:hypothetical protein